jgi:hypothetical protein
MLYFTPIEPSHGNNVGQAITDDSRVKSPGPVNAAKKASKRTKRRIPTFVSTMEYYDMHDSLAMSGVYV